MTKLFENGEITVFDMMAFLNKELETIVPFVNITKGILGNDSIFLLVSFDEKSTWSYGYVNNSNYFRMMIESDGGIYTIVT